MNQFANYLQYHTAREKPQYLKSPIRSPNIQELTFSPQFSPHRFDEFDIKQFRKGIVTNKARDRPNKGLHYQDKENNQNFINLRERKTSRIKQQENSDCQCLVPIDQILCTSVASNSEENLVMIDSVKKQDTQKNYNNQVQPFDEMEQMSRSFKKIKIQSDDIYQQPQKINHFEDQLNSFRSHIQTPRQQHLKKITFTMYKKQIEGKV